VKVSFERRKTAKVFMTHVQDFFRKSLSKATFDRKLSSVSLPLPNVNGQKRTRLVFYKPVLSADAERRNGLEGRKQALYTAAECPCSNTQSRGSDAPVLCLINADKANNIRLIQEACSNIKLGCNRASQNMNM